MVGWVVIVLCDTAHNILPVLSPLPLPLLDLLSSSHEMLAIVNLSKIDNTNSHVDERSLMAEVLGLGLALLYVALLKLSNALPLTLSFT